MPRQSREETPRIIVALGGNAITREGEEGTVEQDYANLRRSLDGVVELVTRGYRVILTHGNGPQVGNQMIRVELSRGQVPELPLDIMVADLQGGLGYMIEIVLRNKLFKAELDTSVCALLTQVEVDRSDPAFDDPSKFVGRAYSREEIDQRAAERGWVVKEDKGRGWRRVVPSPEPQRILEADSIATLVETGAVVIVSGGGGVPVARDDEGLLTGVEAVVDKDYAAAELAKSVDATHLFLLTSVDAVYLDYGEPTERRARFLTVAEARKLAAAGQFPAGSMGPKIEAACRFVENGGQRALITDIFTLIDAIDGSAGTWVTA